MNTRITNLLGSVFFGDSQWTLQAAVEARNVERVG
jgi:hypothetical protein